VKATNDKKEMERKISDFHNMTALGEAVWFEGESEPRLWKHKSWEVNGLE